MIETMDMSLASSSKEYISTVPAYDFIVLGTGEGAKYIATVMAIRHPIQFFDVPIPAVDTVAQTYTNTVRGQWILADPSHKRSKFEWTAMRRDFVEKLYGQPAPKTKLSFVDTWAKGGRAMKGRTNI
jgi:hypothetical protein